MKSPYTELENQVMKNLADAVNAFKKLEQSHPSHDSDFCNGIHKCQDVIIHRIVQRDYPQEFPTYSKGGKE